MLGVPFMGLAGMEPNGQAIWRPDDEEPSHYPAQHGRVLDAQAVLPGPQPYGT
jgi:hypothetical protein